ncbi:MAG: hypothetical protein PWR01_632 [Clostridiales bacterium]|nr:hypothetical protein [Clostridiales bacterium]
MSMEEILLMVTGLIIVITVPTLIYLFFKFLVKHFGRK